VGRMGTGHEVLEKMQALDKVEGGRLRGPDGQYMATFRTTASPGRLGGTRDFGLSATRLGGSC